MQFTLKTVVIAALALAASAAPNKLVPVKKYAGQVKANSYIVKLKAGAQKAALIGGEQANLRGSITHADWDPEFFNGFAGVFNTEQLNKLRASDLVEYIEEDGIFTIQATQTNAPWGISRVSSSGRLPSGSSVSALNYTYVYPDAYQGQGVDIYVVDTGINLSHTEFGGRAKWGWSGSGLATTDDHGHGTHVSGTAAGARYGIAKQANLIAVKVLDSAGSGTLANVIGGFDYARTAAASTGRPSIASASLGGGASTSIDQAVASLVSSGVVAVIAAGNSNVDAGSTSPARVSTAITVGATDINDAKASYSNYGSVVDIWAPGTSVISSYIGSNTATASLSGTSMATPHTSGLTAIYLSQFGKVSPASVSSGLWSVSGAISGIPSGTVNRFIHL